jgi:hypothetical protein
MKKNFKLPFMIIQIVLFSFYINIVSSSDSSFPSDSVNSDSIPSDSGNSDLTSTDSGNSDLTSSDQGNSDLSSSYSGNSDLTSSDQGNSDLSSINNGISTSPTSQSTETTVNTISTIPTPPGNETISNPTIRKSSSGLSTGSICAIAIPTIAALLGVATAAALFTGASASPPGFTAPSLPDPHFIDTLLDKFNIPSEIPI